MKKNKIIIIDVYHGSNDDSVIVTVVREKSYKEYTEWNTRSVSFNHLLIKINALKPYKVTSSINGVMVNYFF